MSSQVETIAIADKSPSDAEIQSMLAKAVRLYTERAAERDCALPAFAPDAGVTATDVMVVTTAMLKSVNVQIFELGMWQAWSGR
jgi:hypothetical protein